MTAAISVGTGLLIAGGVAAAGTVAGAVISSNAAGKAANAQTTAARDANNTQLTMYDTTRADQAPWRGAGGQAVNALSQFYGLGGVNADGTTGTGASGTGTTGTASTPDYNKILSNLPGYQFQQQQGNQAVQRNLAATGLLQSGAAGKALQQYGQGVASQYAGQYVNGLQSLAGLGQTSVANTGAVGANTANQIGSNQIYSGNAQASGYVGQANSVNSGLSGLSGLYGQYNTMSQQQYQQQYNSLQPITPTAQYMTAPADTAPGTTTYFGGP